MRWHRSKPISFRSWKSEVRRKVLRQLRYRLQRSSVLTGFGRQTLDWLTRNLLYFIFGKTKATTWSYLTQAQEKQDQSAVDRHSCEVFFSPSAAWKFWTEETTRTTSIWSGGLDAYRLGAAAAAAVAAAARSFELPPIRDQLSVLSHARTHHAAAEVNWVGRSLCLVSYATSTAVSLSAASVAAAAAALGLRDASIRSAVAGIAGAILNRDPVQFINNKRRGYLAPSGDGTGTGDWKTDGRHYRRCQGVHLPVPAAFRGTTEGKCGLISKHVHSQLARCNPLFHFLNVQCLQANAGGP